MYTLLVTGDVPGAATYFNPLMQQTIIPCTSGTRPSSPPTGMTVYETDTNRYSSYTGSAWVTLGQTVTATYAPTLTGASGNPNIGTTGTNEGRYTLFNGKWCVYRGSVQWGGSSMTSGTGQYTVPLPVTSNGNITNGVSTVGNIMLRDATGPILRTGACYIAAGSATFAMFEATTGIVTSTVPWTWGGSGDYISWTITYETA